MSDLVAVFRLVLLSSIGIFFFFIPITISGKTTIPLDHTVFLVKSMLGPGAQWYALAIIAAGAVFPFYDGSWKANLTSKIFSFFKVLGLVFGVLVVFGWGPELLHSKDMLPFLYNKLAVSVGLIVPIGAVFLALLVSYGLLELVGVLRLCCLIRLEDMAA
nr:hypothetical protein [Enterovibrio nigricans]